MHRHFHRRVHTRSYQEWEEIPVYKDFIIPDLLKLKLGDWARTGGKAAFANMDGAGGTCDTLIEEIAPGGQLKPVRHMYEKAIFILDGQGATTIWNDGGKKHTLEWQKGSLFATPLNAWHQHFNAQGDKPVRMISLTDAPADHSTATETSITFSTTRLPSLPTATAAAPTSGGRAGVTFPR